MSKKFLTLREAEQYICDGKLYVDKKVILASSLQDYVRDNNIEVICGDMREAHSKQEIKNNETQENKEDISLVIEKILRNDFAVQDEIKIKQVIKIMKEVLK